MLKLLCRCRKLCLAVILLTFCSTIIIWNITSLPARKNMSSTTTLEVTDTFSSSREAIHIDYSVNDLQPATPLLVNISALKNRVKGRKECAGVAENPRSFWRSQNTNISLTSHLSDVKRMSVALSCGMLYPEYLSQPALPTLYPLETFYFSQPPPTDINLVSNESTSIVSALNTSLEFTVGDTVAFKIEIRDSKEHRKMIGGDDIRAWFVDGSTKSRMTAKVTDFHNGTYMASAPLLFQGMLRLHVALAYSREFIRVVLFSHQAIKSFHPIFAMFSGGTATEATPCYHTPQVPGFNSTELCNFTQVNGSPWFCGRPVKEQLNCSHYNSTTAIYSANAPVTDLEMAILSNAGRKPYIKEIPSDFTLNVSPGKPNKKEKVPCHKVPPEDTWSQELPTGYMISNSTWHFQLCNWAEPNFTTCLKNIQVMFLGDSNSRKHYEQMRKTVECVDIAKALTGSWHKHLLCVDKANNFSMAWFPHGQPFIHGFTFQEVRDLVGTSKAIDDIPSEGNYLLIVNHYYHLSTTHISAFDFMFRSIKDALVRLFKRNPNVKVLLQSPHAAWHSWVERYTIGDIIAKFMMDLQRKIFHEIRDKVVFFPAWDITLADENMEYHPPIQPLIYRLIFGFMCGR